MIPSNAGAPVAAAPALLDDEGVASFLPEPDAVAAALALPAAAEPEAAAEDDAPEATLTEAALEAEEALVVAGAPAGAEEVMTMVPWLAEVSATTKLAMAARMARVNFILILWLGGLIGKKMFLCLVG